jgi:uncharacterized protein YbjT (DUF2867 family)
MCNCVSLAPFSRILVTGATGYVGGRLVPRLLEAGYRVRAVSRSIEKLAARAWARHPACEVMAADVRDAASLAAAVVECDVAYYFVHSMNPATGDFAEADRESAANMAQVAATARLRRIIYLGGLGEEASGLSHHLRSRHEVAEILKESGVPVTVLRAAMIIGSGSASFELLRYLVDRLPLMLTPRISTPCQPIAIRNVLGYLIGCLEKPETAGETYDIGGAEILSYRRLMQTYSEEAGLGRRLLISLPLLSPRLCSYWITHVAPIHPSIARPLADGLMHPVICREHRIREIIPQEILSPRRAIQLALQVEKEHRVESHWSDAGYLPAVEASLESDPAWSGGAVYEDRRETTVPVSLRAAWKAIIRIGGRTGWYYGDILWILRGLIDRLIGGVGLRRGRRDPERLAAGDALDFWRVRRLIPEQRLTLMAEMKLPGEAILEFAIERAEGGGVRVVQRALFRPRGLMGLGYWHGVSPLHNLVFAGMLRGLARRMLFEEAALAAPPRESSDLPPPPPL